jgi:hypothetical protein
LKVRIWLRVVGVVLAALILLATVGGSLAEEDNRFCASCHMVPERTYFNRGQFALAGVTPIADLASVHLLADPSAMGHDGQFRCVDCHRGSQNIADRVLTLALGSRDALIYFVGNPDHTIQKASAEVPTLLNDSCARCHTTTLLTVGFPNHFHNKLPPAYALWQRGGQLILPERNPDLFLADLERDLELLDVTLTCIDCHQGHIQLAGAEQSRFLDLKNVVYPQCEICHTEILGAPLGLSPPPG